jgi:hypothetical protein
MYMSGYSSAFAYTLSDLPVSCRGISVNASGTVIFNFNRGGADVTVQVTQGAIFPLCLDQGQLRAGGTATDVIVWN